MQKMFFKKGLVCGIILLFVGTSLVPSISGYTGNLQDFNELQYIKSIVNESLLDLKYIHNITENLSIIIFRAYDEEHGEIAQGRAFGTKGEHMAADILYENMIKLGLYTKKEELNNTVVTLADVPKIASKIETLKRGLAVYDINNNSKTAITDYYIGAVRNFTDFGSYTSSILKKLKNNHPIIGSIVEKLLSLIPPYHNGILDKKYNLYDEERLTYNFSYTNLKVIQKPINYSLAMDLFRHFNNTEPFVYIDKYQMFTPWPKQNLTFKGLIYKHFFRRLSGDEMILWTLFQPNCKGVILYDYGNDTFNTGDEGVLPIIYVNRTIGEKIYNNAGNYKIDFYINQSWNDSILSYNVIGQLNGTNPNKTIIISCLYDSMWCQGTGDSAIGMAMVLGIAKYFVDHNITPKYNIRFIGFSGEEYGLRGAYYYEAAHRKDNITTIIDLNQLGFFQIDPRLTLRIFSNNQSLNSTVARIANRTNYVERMNNTTDFETVFKINGGPPSNAWVFARANNDTREELYNTILFVKCYKWPHHHRDGLNHTKGDVMAYFDWNDTSVTGEMVWNITKNFTVDPP